MPGLQSIRRFQTGGGVLTPAIAKDLMQRSMTTGVPTSEFDRYGGYDAVSSVYNQGGGSYGLDSISQDDLKRYATQVANTGVGNLSILPMAGVPLSDAGAAGMRRSGVDENSIAAALRVANPLTPAIARDLMQRSMTTGVPTSEFDRYGGYEAVNSLYKQGGGSYGLDSISQDDLKRYATQVANTGVGNLSILPMAGVPLTEAAIAAMQRSGVDEKTIQNNIKKYDLFSDSSVGPPGLVSQPATRPQLNAGIRALDLGTQKFGDLTRLAQGEPQAAFKIPSTTVASATPAAKAGGLVNFQKGGMSKYTPTEVGSTFDVSEYINPDTGRFYVNEFQRDVVFNPELREAERIERLRLERLKDNGRASGGLMTLAEGGTPMMEAGEMTGPIEAFQDMGRNGDSMLVHMSPEEVQGLQALALRNGTTLTINPETGMPEAFSLKKIFKAALPMLPFLIPGIGTAIAGLGASLSGGALSALASKAIAAGVIGGFTGGGGFNFKQGLKTGAMAYAGGKLFEGINAANAAPGGAGPRTAAAATTPTAVDPSLGGVSVGNVADVGEVIGTNAFSNPQLTPAAAASTTTATGPAFDYSPAGEALPVGTNPPTPQVSLTPDQIAKTSQISAMQPGSAKAANISGFEQATGVSPTTALMGGSLGLSAIQASKEQEAFEAAQAASNQEEEERRRRYAELFGRTLGSVNVASGGLMALAKGGAPMMEAGGTTGPTGEPRMVRGTGDGMSDNVPATIEGVQEARLANDEFVVPADVVADIGNGSSSAGAKKLYDMMDRVRKARHNTTKQPPEINAERLMPA